MRPSAISVAVLIAVSAPALAADSRVRTVSYAANDVVPVKGHYGYQMLIAFEPGERIGNISIGDSTAWLVTPNKEANGVFLKPVEPRASTNMTVQTDRRTYLFELSAARATAGGNTAGMLYKLQFRYPDLARPNPLAAGAVAYNRDYRLSGAREPRPAQVFDDGRWTYFQWGPTATVPAIFAVVGGREELVNHATRGGYVVVERTASAFLLRDGKQTVRIKNRGYRKPVQTAAIGGAR